MMMAALVLLIAVVNLGSLLLVRSAGRVREFATRYALGSALGRLAQQLLVEGLLLGVAGGAVGLLFAPLAMHVIVARLTDESGAAPFSTAVDTRLLLFNFAIAIAASLFFSLAPVLRLRRPDVSTAMRQGSATGASGTLYLRRIIVGLQIGLSLLLLVSARRAGLCADRRSGSVACPVNCLCSLM